ncbi:zinc-ribbon domain-containing protein [Patescibacteria group bacterium]|nr:zinc-ribbon domain-containing protein [Patescibacteria group bacterium]
MKLFNLDLVKGEFYSELNPEITFETLTQGGRQIITWKCSKGDDHIWEASLNQRTSGNKLRGCPVCAGKKVVTSNSLLTTNPEIAKEWNYERNKTITPSTITYGSNKKVWWQCLVNESHVWLASPKQRVNNNTCPHCDSLQVKYPDIAREWHPTKNNSLRPQDIASSSHTKVWWKCEKGVDHVWLSSPNTRVSNKSGCPICSGYKVVKSNCLAITHPELSSQWDYVKNANNLTPENVHAGSHKKVWWRCPKGDDHNWESVVKTRAKQGVGCPICSGRKVSLSNSLATKEPVIASLWHPTKNEPLNAYQVTPYSGQLVWWKCPEGEDHEWKSTVANLVNGSSCPVCMNRKITKNNNLFALFPDLKDEWDFEKNKDVNPVTLSAGSRMKVWWVCKRDPEHMWFSTIKDRTAKESGCPYCSIKLNVSELKMLGIIKQLFEGKEILYRYKPKWLNRMELDVYVPELKLAFEYQGAQHIRPIDFFGGEMVYIEQVKRDQLKKNICHERNVTLLYCYFDEKLSLGLIKSKIDDSGITLI